MIVNRKFIDFTTEVINKKEKVIKSFNFKSNLSKKGNFLFFWPQNFHNDAKEIILLINEMASHFKTKKINFFGVSVDSIYSHQAFLEQLKNSNYLNKLEFTIISDLNKDISRDYFVLDNELTSSFAMFYINHYLDIKYVEMSANLLEINKDKLTNIINNSKYDKKIKKTI